MTTRVHITIRILTSIKTIQTEIRNIVQTNDTHDK